MRTSRKIDPRVKQNGFSWKNLIGIFLVLMILAIGQSFIIVIYFGSYIIPTELLSALVVYWAIVSVIFSAATALSVRKRYEMPLKQMSDISKRVAEGDFKAKLQTAHHEDKYDYLDVIFLDFNKMVDELASIEILKNDFVSNVSHEIKTPLSVIQNYATLLQDENATSEQRKEYIEIIFNASEQLTALVTNILKLSKLENQKIHPVAKEYDVCRQLGDCILNFENQLEGKQIDFCGELEDKAIIKADESLVEIIWNNLLSNAIKFTPEKGQITLLQKSDKNFVYVSVKDSGCGMTTETLKHIFDKFYQGDPSHYQNGNGLGLALVKRVLDLTGGEISVESKFGKGSMFTVKFNKYNTVPA